MARGDPSARSELMRSEPATTEAVVGGLTSVIQERADVAGALEGLNRLFEAQERELPDWLTAEFIERVKDQMRRLRGEWRATPFGGEMRLLFG
jgi:hypothetical protein